MAKRVEDAILDTPAAREKLAPGIRHWRAIKPGVLHIGYYRGGDAGSWLVRIYRGRGGGRAPYDIKTIARSDDRGFIADGVRVLDYNMAEELARQRYREHQERQKNGDSSQLTVRKAVEQYLAKLKVDNGKRAEKDTRQRLERWYLPRIADKLVIDLKTKDILACRDAMVRDDPDPERVRASKDTSNRTLSMIKAALNYAFEDEDNKIPSSAAWDRVIPFEDVGRARQVFLDVAQQKRLINVCEGEFRKLVTASLLTGARPPHELASMRVRDFDASTHSVYVPDSKVEPRHVTLSEEAMGYFSDIAAGKDQDALIFTQDSGRPWGRADHIRPMREAAQKAKLPKGTTIYTLRHSHASQAILNGANLKLLAENMGTSIAMLERHYGKFIKASRQKLVEQSAPKLGLKRSNVRAMS